METMRGTADGTTPYIRVVQGNESQKKVLRFHRANWAMMWKVNSTANANRVKKETKLRN